MSYGAVFTRISQNAVYHEGKKVNEVFATIFSDEEVVVAMA